MSRPGTVDVLSRHRDVHCSPRRYVVSPHCLSWLVSWVCAMVVVGGRMKVAGGVGDAMLVNDGGEVEKVCLFMM